MKTLSLPAPAKLNLMLHITGRRPDGYHELQTLFQFLDYADELHFSIRNDDNINLLTPMPGVEHDSNLIVKAARLLQSHSQTACGVDISIDKKLPMGGGLGGGSSNAATVLLALNHLWNLSYSLDELAQLGLQLGADVPVFVHGHAAFAEGIGEKLTPVDLAEPWFLVAIPRVSISTAEVFNDPELTRDSQPIKVRPVLEQDGRNDCQAVVEKRYPDVRNALNLLSNFCDAKLTGTGSCIFGSFSEYTKATQALTQLSNALPGFVAKGSNVSMLHRRLRNLFETSA